MGRFIALVEDALLALLLAGMILLAAAQILLRNFMDLGLVWGDPLLRALVLWVGLLGAMVAARSENHIAIDVLSRHLPPRGQAATRLLTNVFTVAVCAVMSYYSAQLVRMDLEAGVMAFGPVPAWWVESILPFGFAVLALRYLAAALRNLRPLLRPRAEEGNGA